MSAVVNDVVGHSAVHEFRDLLVPGIELDPALLFAGCEPFQLGRKPPGLSRAIGGDASAHSWSTTVPTLSSWIVPTRTGQKRRLPVGSCKYVAALVVPMKTHCRGDGNIGTPIGWPVFVDLAGQ